MTVRAKKKSQKKCLYIYIYVYMCPHLPCEHDTGRNYAPITFKLERKILWINTEAKFVNGGNPTIDGGRGGDFRNFSFSPELFSYGFFFHRSIFQICIKARRNFFLI